MKTKKVTLLNDPIYGFIGIRSPLIFMVISHPCFQRLRRISHMGFSYYVYPGAQHTRFEHALGVMHLMQGVIEILSKKGKLKGLEEINTFFNSQKLSSIQEKYFLCFNRNIHLT